MKKYILSVVVFLTLLPLTKGQPNTGDITFVDPEQQQLEWCFQFSNLFGYDINYISNPRLYKNISQWLGTPYRYSGDTEKGIDCSGFVCQIYASSFNKKMTGSARDIFETVQPLKRSELREGDLVFFKIDRGRISHVGIYLGQNKFAHSSTQRGVIISDLEEDYYNKYFFKGGRVSF